MQHYAKMLRVAHTILYDEEESRDVVSEIFASQFHGRTAPTLPCANYIPNSRDHS